MGRYVSQFSFENHQAIFQAEIYDRLNELLKILHSRLESDDESEVEAAANLHQSTVLDNFFHHASKGGGNHFISHSTCFSCLFEPPEHPLPCGHVLCTPCLMAYGKRLSKTVVEIIGCPMETLIRSRKQAWKVSLKPTAAGLRILTLDGSASSMCI